MSRRGLCIFLTLAAGLCALSALGGITGVQPLANVYDGAQAVVDSSTSVPVVDIVATAPVNASRQLAHRVGTAAWLAGTGPLWAIITFSALVLIAISRRRRLALLTVRSRAPPRA